MCLLFTDGLARERFFCSSKCKEY